MTTFKIKGLHLNVAQNTAEGRKYYHYAWRGKGAPRIAETATKLRKGELPADLLEAALAARKAVREPAKPKKPASALVRKTLRDLFAEWQASGEYRAEVKSEATRELHDANIAKWVEGSYRTEGGEKRRFGDMPLIVVVDDGARDKFLNFRDQHATGWRPCKVSEAEANKAKTGSAFPAKPRVGDYFVRTDGPKPYGFQYRETPKAADHLTSTLGACLSWAKRRGKIKVNQIEGVEKLYSANRSLTIWEPEPLEALKAGAAISPAKPCPPQVWNVVLGAALTGLAQVDLLRLSWPMILEDVIDLEGGRQKTGVEAMPPILPETRVLFERLRRDQEEAKTYDPQGFVFLNSRGKPWTVEGFRASFQDAKAAGGIGKELHFHDLRGTAATMFVSSPRNYSDLQIDLFMGWTEGEGARIRRKYVNGRNVAKGLQALLKGETKPALSLVGAAQV